MNELKFTTAGDYMKMNERIKQLAAKANFGHMENNEVVYDPRLEKFAELIILDCIDIVAPYTVRMSRPGEEYLHPIQEIMKHFGVKE